jgi:Lar family restriction alleviation protein
VSDLESDSPTEAHPHRLLERGLREAVRRSGSCHHGCPSSSVTLILDPENPLNACLCGCALAWFRQEYPAHSSIFIFSTQVPSGGSPRVPPCPFCECTSFHSEGSEDNGGITFILSCDRCHATGPIVTDHENRSMPAWSLRTTTPRDWLGAAFRGNCYEHPLPPDGSGVLRGCPFCGHSRLHVSGDEDGPPFLVSCDTCEVGGPSSGDRDGAIRSWNNRA